MSQAKNPFETERAEFKAAYFSGYAQGEAEADAEIACLRRENFVLLKAADDVYARLMPMVESLRAKLAAWDWQPIETAPKDGTHILLYTPAYDYQGARCDVRITYGYWDVPKHGEQIGDCGGACRCPEYDDASEPYWYSDDGGFLEELPPTHWMPLPPPPHQR